jgi:hypothetical protein
MSRSNATPERPYLPLAHRIDPSACAAIPAGELWIGMSWWLYEPWHPLPVVVWRCRVDGCRTSSGVVAATNEARIESAYAHLRDDHPETDPDTVMHDVPRREWREDPHRAPQSAVADAPGDL